MSAPPGTIELQTLFTGAGGLITVVGLVAWAIKSLGARVLAREDADKAAMSQRLKEQDDAIKALAAKRVDETSQMKDLQRDVQELTKTLGEMKGQLQQATAGIDQRIEGTGRYQRDELEKLRAEMDRRFKDFEFAIRQDVTRIIADQHPRAKRG